MTRVVEDLRLEEKREFDEGDLGLAGCIQAYEPSGLHRQNEEPIKRYGGTTAAEAPWPEEKPKKGPAEDPDGASQQCEEHAMTSKST